MPEIPALSPSIAHVLDSESALHAWTVHRLLGNKPRPTTDDQEQGQLLHALILEDRVPEDRLEIVPFDTYRKDAARALRDQARAERKIPLLERELAGYLEIAGRVRKRITALGYDLTAGHPERRVEWLESTPDGDVICHGQLDWIRDDHQLVLDLKTTDGSAHPDLCRTKLLRTAGVIQDAAYRRAVESERPELAGRVELVFLFAQLVEPYDVAPIVCGATMREVGVQRWARACETWARCLRTGRWPGYVEFPPYRIEAPGWVLARELGEGG